VFLQDLRQAGWAIRSLLGRFALCWPQLVLQGEAFWLGVAQCTCNMLEVRGWEQHTREHTSC
jgi:hypothetical protein